jgi:hypothetical protein
MWPNCANASFGYTFKNLFTTDQATATNILSTDLLENVLGTEYQSQINVAWPRLTDFVVLPYGCKHERRSSSAIGFGR